MNLKKWNYSKKIRISKFVCIENIIRKIRSRERKLLAIQAIMYFKYTVIEWS
jgi:hypothetical protein